MKKVYELVDKAFEDHAEMIEKLLNEGWELLGMYTFVEYNGDCHCNVEMVKYIFNKEESNQNNTHIINEALKYPCEIQDIYKSAYN